jgi:recombination protein RecA
MFGSGISTEGEVLEIADSVNIINKAGAWYSYGDVRMGQGRENSKQFLRDNPDIFAEIVMKVKKALGMLENKEQNNMVENNNEEKKRQQKNK